MTTLTVTTLGGLDIGGTTCAATLARADGDGVEILDRRSFPTPPTPSAALAALADALADLVDSHGGALDAIGVSCGGPLDSARGLILSPPNLPGWDRVDVLAPLRQRFGVPAALQNDANAGALAEWQWGAGRGCRHMVFLTFGTGMGAGLILNGRLYLGATGDAGEVGHVRLADDGPVGFGKAGSFEGFCSGGGIARLARSRADAHRARGGTTRLAAEPDALTAQTVAAAADAGDAVAVGVYQTVGERLGQGLALLVDVLNPQRIVVGSIYGRQQSRLEPVVLGVLRREALPASLAACEIVPAGLGERVGDHAALAVAQLAVREPSRR